MNPSPVNIVATAKTNTNQVKCGNIENNISKVLDISTRSIL